MIYHCNPASSLGGGLRRGTFLNISTYTIKTKRL